MDKVGAKLFKTRIKKIITKSIVTNIVSQLTPIHAHLNQYFAMRPIQQLTHKVADTIKGHPPVINRGMMRSLTVPEDLDKAARERRNTIHGHPNVIATSSDVVNPRVSFSVSSSTLVPVLPINQSHQPLKPMATTSHNSSHLNTNSSVKLVSNNLTSNATPVGNAVRIAPSTYTTVDSTARPRPTTDISSSTTMPVVKPIEESHVVLQPSKSASSIPNIVRNTLEPSIVTPIVVTSSAVVAPVEVVRVTPVEVVATPVAPTLVAPASEPIVAVVNSDQKPFAWFNNQSSTAVTTATAVPITTTVVEVVDANKQV